MGANVSISERHKLDTIPKLMQHWSKWLPDRELFVFYNGDRREAYTSRQVLQLAGKFASRLKYQHGFKKGDTIANALPNSPERVVTDLGIILAGCVTLNGSMMFSDGSDFLTCANNSGLLAAIVCPEGNGPAWKFLKNYIRGDATSSTAALACDKAPSMATAILVSRQPTGSRENFLQELQQSTEQMFVEEDVQADDILIVLTTSGSTGYCKLVPRTHRNVIEQWLDACLYVKQHSSQHWATNVVYNDRPIGWMGGFPYGTYVNADTRVMLDVFDTLGSKLGADTWQIICKEQVDYAFILPLDFDYLLKFTSFKGVANYKMKMICCGGQPIRKDQFLTYYTVGHEVGVAYASSEAGFISYGIVEENKVKDYFCGQVQQGVRVRVVDDNNQPCPTATVGAVQVTGMYVFKGYLNRVENPDPKTLSAFTRDGWLDMADSGYFDEHRNLYVLGRLKEVIMFGSAFVYPGWLEPKIIQHPAISEACIVPVSDPVLYHNICAIVKQVPGSDLDVQQLQTLCHSIFSQDKDMEGTPIPKFYMILQEFPQTATGKVDRTVLQKMAEDKFGTH